MMATRDRVGRGPRRAWCESQKGLCTAVERLGLGECEREIGRRKVGGEERGLVWEERSGELTVVAPARVHVYGI